MLTLPPDMTRPRLVLAAALLASLALGGCSCKEWGYCPQLFPNAERFAGNS
jgi:hypothetical protein